MATSSFDFDAKKSEPFPDFSNTYFELAVGDSATPNVTGTDPFEMFTTLGPDSPGIQATAGAVEHNATKAPGANRGIWEARNANFYSDHTQELAMSPLDFTMSDSFNVDIDDVPFSEALDLSGLDAPGLEVFDQLMFPETGPFLAQIDGEYSFSSTERNIDFSDPSLALGDFPHAVPTALTAALDDIEGVPEKGPEPTPQTAFGQEDDDRNRYAHFSVPIDTLPEESDVDEPDHPVKLSCGITLNKIPKVSNPFPCLDEVGWHPGQPYPILSSTASHASNQITPLRQTARSGMLPPTPLAPKRDSKSINAEYERLTSEHDRKMAAKLKSVQDLSRTTKDAVKAVQRQAVKRYSAITGKAFKRLPRERKAIPARGGGSVSATVNAALPTPSARKTGGRKAKGKWQCSNDSDSDSEVTEFAGESDDTSAGEGGSSGEESDGEPPRDFGSMKSNRKRAMHSGPDLRRSKRVCRPSRK